MTEEEKRESTTSYQGLFVISIVFIGAGAALSVTNIGMLGLMVMGLIFMIIGLGNRNKWKTTQYTESGTCPEDAGFCSPELASDSLPH